MTFSSCISLSLLFILDSFFVECWTWTCVHIWYACSWWATEYQIIIQIWRYAYRFCSHMWISNFIFEIFTQQMTENIFQPLCWNCEYTLHNWNSSYNCFHKLYLQAAATQLHKLEEKAGKEVGGEIEAELGVKINESQICSFFY